VTVIDEPSVPLIRFPRNAPFSPDDSFVVLKLVHPLEVGTPAVDPKLSPRKSTTKSPLEYAGRLTVHDVAALVIGVTVAVVERGAIPEEPPPGVVAVAMLDLTDSEPPVATAVTA
jgi:hypothetical protein